MTPDPAFDARFQATLEASGLTLTPDEAARLGKLAAWMHDGLAGGPATPLLPVETSILELSIQEQGDRLRDGRLTSLALVEATLARIAERDPDYLSFYCVLADTARADAARADQELASGEDRGALHGIPVGIKDLIDVAGVPTTANAPGRAEAIADQDAELVTRLRRGGAIIIGKLATYEWATVGPDRQGLFPPARNPWKLDHITGGSSSGPAAAVAGGLIRTTIGTDSGGSVRGPSFYCGTVGLKPTYGSVAGEGVLELSSSLDHVGPISASVAEAALTLDVLTGQSGLRSATGRLGEPVSDLRIGYARNWFAHDPQTMPAVLAAVDDAVSRLSWLGAVVKEIDLPDYASIEVAVATILHAESFRLHAEDLRDHPEGYGRRAFLSLAAGLAISESELARARDMGAQFRDAVDALLDQHDVLITAGALTTALPAAPFEKEAVWTPMRTIGFNVSGHPVLALPVGFHDGLPIGMQIIGRHHAEARIVQFGDALEKATEIGRSKPPRRR
ncbi:amidase [Devosia sp. CAU 1758]